MLKKDLILRNPLRLLGNEQETILSPGGFGAILARAGVGQDGLLLIPQEPQGVPENQVLFQHKETPFFQIYHIFRS